jgi:uncharacterized membrane protein
MEQAPEMESALYEFARYIALVLDAIAVLLVAVGAVDALFGISGTLLNRHSAGADKRGIYIRFANWLVAALTFQLGADIVETTVAPGWDDIGRVAAIAVIRTFLTYFLDRDLEKARDTQRAKASGEVPSEKI